GRASGHHDPRGDDTAGAREGRHFRWAAAPVDGHRGARRPAGRHRRGARARAGGAGRECTQAGGRMSAVVRLSLPAVARGQVLRVPRPEPRLALLGTGTVGRAFVERCERLRAQGVEVPGFAWLSNTRALREGSERPLEALAQLDAAAPVHRSAWAPWVESEGLRPGDVVVDATASDSVAGWHSEWLARGIHVVTANKLGNGTELARAQAIVEAQEEGGARYGDSATVGAGLPLLRSIRELVAGGDRIRCVEGVLSGSLAWLFDRHDGSRPFSALVREARDLGYA